MKEAIVVAAGGVLLLSLGIQTSTPPPDNAQVYFNTGTQKYASPVCVENAESADISRARNDASYLPRDNYLMTKRAAKLRGGRLHEASYGEECWHQNQSLLAVSLLGHPFLRSSRRWGPDGRWNW